MFFRQAYSLVLNSWIAARTNRAAFEETSCIAETFFGNIGWESALLSSDTPVKMAKKNICDSVFTFECEQENCCESYENRSVCYMSVLFEFCLLLQWLWMTVIVTSSKVWNVVIAISIVYDLIRWIYFFVPESNRPTFNYSNASRLYFITCEISATLNSSTHWVFSVFNNLGWYFYQRPLYLS